MDIVPPSLMVINPVSACCYVCHQKSQLSTAALSDRIAVHGLNDFSVTSVAPEAVQARSLPIGPGGA
jgi:hypothetical protein